MRSVLSDLERVAEANCAVLLEGESGTGKELVARVIHDMSAGDAPFEAVNCGAIPETLLESELFGHVAGSFTGATRDHRGVFERAGHGTVFLDEIAEMSPSAQVKLLRVLQESNFKPVGGEKNRQSHARVVAATNRDLQREVKQDRFRLDLYYRLSVFPIRLPNLHERREDIPLLVEHFLDVHARELGTARPIMHPAALKRLMVYSFPGNVRELQNLVSALLIESRGTAEILDRHVVSVFSRHRLDHALLEEEIESDAGPSIEVGRWVLEQLRQYGFNIALAERMLSTRRREAADGRRVPVCSRSGLTYYLQGEGFRALAHERWNVEAAAVTLAHEPAHRRRVRNKLIRFLETARGALERGKTPSQRLIHLKKSFAKLPQEYQDDLYRVAEEYERGRWA
jgi:transcriptional regulator with GAF, ATPase, and Fis domain